MTKQANEGEGNRTSAKKFNKEEKAFVQSGRVPEASAAALLAVNGPESVDLKKAEEVGLSKRRT